MDITGPYLVDRIKPWVNDAIVRHAQGDNVVWDTDVIGMQVEPGVIRPCFGLILWMPSAVLGDVIVSNHAIPDPTSIGEAEIDEIVRQRIEEMHQTRSAALTIVQPDPQGNGAR